MIDAIIGAICGIVIGYAIAALVAWRSVNDIWNTAHEEGFREGVETEKINRIPTKETR